MAIFTVVSRHVRRVCAVGGGLVVKDSMICVLRKTETKM